MRTTLDINPDLLETVEKITGEKSPSKAVNAALAEFIRSHMVEELIALAGHVEIEGNWRELEEGELEEAARTARGEW